MEPRRLRPSDEHAAPANRDGGATDSDEHSIASNLHASPANGYPGSADEHARAAISNPDASAGQQPLHDSRP